MSIGKDQITDSMRRCMVREPALRMPERNGVNWPIVGPMSLLKEGQCSVCRQLYTGTAFHVWGKLCYQCAATKSAGMPRQSLEKALDRVLTTETTNHANDHKIDDTGANAKPQRPARDAPLDARQGKEKGAGRVHLRIVSVRKRLCDPDNLVPKWYIDCLRYCGAIDQDTPEAITLEVSQRKAAKGEAEHTEIVIEYP